MIWYRLITRLRMTDPLRRPPSKHYHLASADIVLVSHMIYIYTFIYFWNYLMYIFLSMQAHTLPDVAHRCMRTHCRPWGACVLMLLAELDMATSYRTCLPLLHIHRLLHLLCPLPIHLPRHLCFRLQSVRGSTDDVRPPLCLLLMALRSLMSPHLVHIDLHKRRKRA